MIKIFILTIAVIQTYSITFPLTRNRQNCLYIRQKGEHEMQYIVSGQNPKQYRCQIFSNSNIIQIVQSVTEFQTVINFQSDNNKICFTTLDNQMKQVSFDIISTEDPLKDHFSVKDEEETHMKMYAAFQELEKVHRDQNMFIQRSTIYRNVLANKEIKLIFILIFKVIVALALGGYQLLLIKEIVTSKNYQYTLPPGVQGNDSDEQMD